MKQRMQVEKWSVLFLFMLVMPLVFGIRALAAAPANVRQTDDGEAFVTVEWDEAEDAGCYGVEVASDAGFTNILCRMSKETGLGTKAVISNLDIGQTYYARVGYGETSADCYNNWSSVIEVVTRPGKLDRVKFADADDKTVTLKWDAADGANLYYVKYNNQVLTTKTNSIRLNYVSGVSVATVVPARSSTDGSYVAERKADWANTSVENLSALTRKIAKKSFGIKETQRYSTYVNGKSENDYEVYADYVGSGLQVYVYDVRTGKKKFSGSVRFKDVFAYNTMYKYRVRAYVNTADGDKIYGNWSDYRYFINLKSIFTIQMATRQNSLITLNWGKLKGVSKIKVQVSPKEKKGYKTCATLKGTKTKYNITRYGKKKLKKISDSAYYIKIILYAKDGKKQYPSDIIYRVNYRKW